MPKDLPGSTYIKLRESGVIESVMINIYDHDKKLTREYAAYTRQDDGSYKNADGKITYDNQASMVEAIRATSRLRREEGVNGGLVVDYGNGGRPVPNAKVDEVLDNILKQGMKDIVRNAGLDFGPAVGGDGPAIARVASKQKIMGREQ
jgi:hypothetical protein